MYYNDTIAKDFDIVKIVDDTHIWFKLEKVFFCFAKDVYIAQCYVVVVPGNTRLDVDTFHVLANNIAGYQSDDDKCIIICGDFNICTAQQPDYAIIDIQRNVPLPLVCG